MNKQALLCVLFVTSPLAAKDYYVSPKGDDGAPGSLQKPWKSLAKASQGLEAGDRVLIRAGTYKERFRPQVSGREGAPVVYEAYSGEKPVIDGTGQNLGDWGGLVHLEGRSWIEIRGLTIQNAGPGKGDAGILAQGCEHLLIQGNRTYNTVASGIGIWRSKDVRVFDNEIELACNDGSQECLTMAGTENFEIKGNTVHNGGPGHNGAEGIDVKDGSSHGTVHHNHVYDLNRVGLYVDAWDKPTFDIEVYENVVHDCRANGMAAASENGGLLENVRFRKNLVYRNKHVGFTLGSWGEPVPHHPLKDIVVENNTFAYNGLPPWGGGIQLDNAEAGGVVIRNNIVASGLTFQINMSKGPKDAFVIHNFIQGYEEKEGNIKGAEALEGDPQFVDPEKNDFHLKPGSPASGLGNYAETGSSGNKK